MPMLPAGRVRSCMKTPSLVAGVVVLGLLSTSCSRSKPSGRSFDLHGQVLAVDEAGLRVTISHDEIAGFMPAMTMPFRVKEARLLKNCEPGDLVRATLFVTDTDAWLTSLERTGHAALPATEAAVPPTVLAPGAQVPDARLVDTLGHPFQFSSLRGQVVALTFIYTRCPLPDYCPLMDRLFAAVLKGVQADGRLRDQVRLLSISFDPEYDTPAVLAAYSRSVGADGRIWRFATADRRTLDAFAPRFGEVIMRDDPRVITHNLRTAIVDRDGRLVKVYNGNDWTPVELLQELTSVVVR
jgi:protein SCO1/2